MNERTGRRERLSEDERAELVTHARASLERMVEITESQQGLPTDNGR